MAVKVVSECFKYMAWMRPCDEADLLFQATNTIITELKGER